MQQKVDSNQAGNPPPLGNNVRLFALQQPVSRLQLVTYAATMVFLVSWFVLHSALLPFPTSIGATFFYAIVAVIVADAVVLLSISDTFDDALAEPLGSVNSGEVNDSQEDGVAVAVVSTTQCSACNVQVPANSRHCLVCNLCTAGYNHHNRWLNICIGDKTRLYYEGFLLCYSVMLLYQLAFGLYGILACAGTTSQGLDNCAARLRVRFGIENGNGTSAAVVYLFFSVVVMLALLVAGFIVGQACWFHFTRQWWKELLAVRQQEPPRPGCEEGMEHPASQPYPADLPPLSLSTLHGSLISVQ